MQEHELATLVKELKSRIDKHDVQLNDIYAAIKNLLAEKLHQKSWQERERIGFKK